MVRYRHWIEHSLRLSLAFFASWGPIKGQDFIFTFAGADWVFPDRALTALDAPLGHVSGVTSDKRGNLYIADTQNHLVLKVATTGLLTIVAGNGIRAFSGDGGPGVRASLHDPVAVAVDELENIYITDAGNHRVRRIDRLGTISTFAGDGRAGFRGDNGPATSASLNSPLGVFIHPSGDVYIADSNNDRVRKVSLDGIISTIAGAGLRGYSGDDGPAVKASLSFPRDVAARLDGSIFIADTSNHVIRKVAPNGIISTVAGTGEPGFSGVQLNYPTGVAFGPGGNLFIADSENHRVRMLAEGILTTVAGTGGYGFSGDGGPGARAALTVPVSLSFDPSGSLYIADRENGRIRRLAPNQIISTFAGNGAFRAFADGTPASKAFLNKPQGLAFDLSGNIYIADAESHRIRKITPQGVISTVAGTGAFNCCMDGGPATDAFLGQPSDVALDADGNLYIADTRNQRIRRVSVATGRISTFVSRLVDPRGIALDSGGNLYIADGTGGTVRKVTPEGSVSVFAGTGSPGPLGDGGRAISASLRFPSGVVVDPNGNVYIADMKDHRVRRVGVDGIIATLAGNGTPGFSGDGGPATSATLNGPTKLALDSRGNLYVVDSGNHRIRKISPVGFISTVSTAAGSGNRGFTGDGGLATSAALSLPSAAVLDSSGKLYISDTENDRIRRVETVVGSLRVSEETLLLLATEGGEPTAPATVSVTAEGILQLPFAVSASPSWLQVRAERRVTPTTLEVFVVPFGLRRGEYRGEVVIEARGAIPPIRRVAVRLIVCPCGEPASVLDLRVDPMTLSLIFGQRSATAIRHMNIFNPHASSSVMFSVESTGGLWLSVSAPPPRTVSLPGLGPSGSLAVTLPPLGSTSLRVTVDPSRLSQGTSTGDIVLSFPRAFPDPRPAQQLIIPITVVKSVEQQTLHVPISGLTFSAVEGGATLVPAQTFGVFNLGQEEMAWEVSKTPLLGETGWLSFTPARGVTAPGSPAPSVRVSVTPRNLKAGEYYGQLKVTAEKAANSPQFVSVLLKIIPAGQNLGPILQPAGASFTATEGGASRGSQEVTIYNTGSRPLSFNTYFLTPDNSTWLNFRPAQGTINLDQPIRITIQANPAGLRAGTYRGALAFYFEDTRVRFINVVLAVAPGPSSTRIAPLVASGHCTPRMLLPVITWMGLSDPIPAGVPSRVEVKVTDDLDCPMTSGAVTTEFSALLENVSLTSLEDGTWEGVWIPPEVPEASATARAELAGAMGSSPVKDIRIGPRVDAPGAVNVVNAASFVGGAQAPGSWISIFGSRLASTGVVEQAAGPPYPTVLGGTSVTLAGRPLPLHYVRGDQVSGMLPYHLPQTTRPLLIVARANAVAMTPYELSLTAAKPGIYRITHSDLVTPVTPERPDRPGRPARPSDVVVIWATGLGAVRAQVTTDMPASPSPCETLAAGAPAPFSPLCEIASPVSVTIGGLDAPVLFAGLSPGSVGLYQVNVRIPAIAQSGPADVILSVGNSVSQPRVTVEVIP